MVSRAIDLTGQTFGYLTVLERAENNISPSGGIQARWLCKCNCGNLVVSYSNNLRRGTAKSCGCLQKEAVHNSSFKNLTGLKFGRLTVLEFSHKNKRNASYWKCECDCGKTVITRSNGLISGHTKSCGCLQRETVSSTIGGWNFKDLSGKVFGKLRVLSHEGRSKKRTLWKCLCECGNEVVVSTGDLQSGNTKSCGCQNESFIASELKKYFIENYDAEKEKKLFKNPETRQWFKCDIYIPHGENSEINGFYIEVHGEQHYKINGWHNQQSERSGKTPEEEFKYQKHKDKIKKKHCKKNGHYIEVNLLKIKTVDDAIDYIEKQIKKIIGEK